MEVGIIRAGPVFGVMGHLILDFRCQAFEGLRFGFLCETWIRLEETFDACFCSVFGVSCSG